MTRRNQKDSYIDCRLYKTSNYSEIRAILWVLKKARTGCCSAACSKMASLHPEVQPVRLEGGGITTLLQLWYSVLSQQKWHYSSQRGRHSIIQVTYLTKKPCVRSGIDKMARSEGRKGRVEARIKEHVEFCPNISKVIWNPILSFTMHNPYLSNLDYILFFKCYVNIHRS